MENFERSWKVMKFQKLKRVRTLFKAHIYVIVHVKLWVIEWCDDVISICSIFDKYSTLYVILNVLHCMYCYWPKGQILKLLTIRKSKYGNMFFISSSRKYFCCWMVEPSSISCLTGVMVCVRVVFRETVVGDWHFDCWDISLFVLEVLVLNLFCFLGQSNPAWPVWTTRQGLHDCRTGSLEWSCRGSGGTDWTVCCSQQHHVFTVSVYAGKSNENAFVC